MRSVLPLTASDLVLAAEALLLVPVAAVSTRLVGLPRAVSIICRLARRLPPVSRSCDEQTARIVSGAASRVGARCLTRALVVHAALDRRGIPSQVVVGISSLGGQFKSHAWVDSGGESLLGSTTGWNPIWRSGL